MRNRNYVENGKISSRQTMRLYMFDLMGIATLLLPPYLARLCGANGIYAIVVGTGLGYLYLFYLGWIMKKMKTDMMTYLKEETGKGLRRVCLFLISIHSVITAGFCAHVFANLMKYSLVQDSSYEIILLFIIGVAAYAVSGGIESRARVYEVLFWIILIPFFPMMFTSIRNVKWRYLEPMLHFAGTNFGKGVYLVFLLLTPLFFVLFLVAEKEKNYGRNIIKTVSASVLFSAAILLGSYVILLGNFGTNSLSNLRFPIVTLMSTIQFEGIFLKRMDALMLAVWFFTLYALLNLHLHYGVRIFAELVDREKRKQTWWQVLIPAGIVFFVAYAMHLNQGWLELFFAYYSYVAVPFMIGFPGAIVLFRRKKNEK